jgi:hypothetical protein
MLGVGQFERRTVAKNDRAREFAKLTHRSRQWSGAIAFITRTVLAAAAAAGQGTSVAVNAGNGRGAARRVICSVVMKVDLQRELGLHWFSIAGCRLKSPLPGRF